MLVLKLIRMIITLISNQQLIARDCLSTIKVSFVLLHIYMYIIVVFLFLVLPVYRKRRVHRTVNLLTGVADANPADLVVSYMVFNELCLLI